MSVVDDEETAPEDGPILHPLQDENDDVTSIEDADESDDEVGSDGSETVGSEDDEILMMLGLSDMNSEASDDSDTEPALGERGAFRKLWEILVQWATPATFQLVCQYSNTGELQNEPVDQGVTDVAVSDVTDNQHNHENNSRNTIDVGASRRAGIMNMIRMNISRSLSELKSQHDVTDRRKVEKCLADLVNTFDCTGATADFDMKLWRGMTTILIAIVAPAPAEAQTAQLPKSIATLGIASEEYRYLTRRALVDLNQK